MDARSFYPQDLQEIFRASGMSDPEVEKAMAAIEAEVAIDEPPINSVVWAEENPEYVFSRTGAGWKQVGSSSIVKWSTIIEFEYWALLI